MTLKTTTTPYDRLELTEWRTAIAESLGVAYASLSTSAATRLDRIVNAAQEYISQRAAHTPKLQREKTFTLTAASDQELAMPADFRSAIRMQEERTDGTNVSAVFTTKTDWMDARDGSVTHPWITDSRAKVFFDGMSSAEPPVEQWRRVGVSAASATLRVIYRPFFNLLSTGADAFTDLPASETEAILKQAQAQWALYNKDYEAYGVLRQDREDHINALETGDRKNFEEPFEQGMDVLFRRL